jgi:PAS domain S-box-containing protein
MADLDPSPAATPAAAASADLLRLVAENLDVVFYVTTPREGRVLYQSPALEGLYGAPPGALAERHERILDFVHEHDRPRVLTALQRQAAGERTEIEYRVTRDDGSVRWIRDRAVVLQGSTRPLVVGVAQDITQERRREAERSFMADASALLTSLLEPDRVLRELGHLAVPWIADWCRVHVVEEDGRVVAGDPVHRDPGKLALIRELERRYPPRGDRTSAVHRVITTGKAELHAEVTEQQLAAAVQGPAQLEMFQAIGIRSAMVVPLRTRTVVLGALSLAAAESGRRYDRADLARAEELAQRAALALENARLHREARRTRLEADEARRVAEAASQAKSEFLAFMSHELRTPLNAVVGYADLLASGVGGTLEGKQTSYVTRIKESAGVLLSLIEEILNLARIEAGRVEVTVTELDACKVVTDALALIEPQARRKGLDLVTMLPEPAARVHTDEGKLRQILLNLLSNAVKFTDQGRVETRLEVTSSDAVFQVRDTGPGIPVDKREEVFQPFARLAGQRERRGTGLGLAVVRRYAALLGGEVSIEDADGGGALFVLRVPVAAPPPPAAPPP